MKSIILPIILLLIATLQEGNCDCKINFEIVGKRNYPMHFMRFRRYTIQQSRWMQLRDEYGSVMICRDMNLDSHSLSDPTREIIRGIRIIDSYLPEINNDTFTKYKSVRFLILNENNVTDIKSGSFNILKLENVELANNKLTDIKEHTFNEDLIKLDLSYNSLTSLKNLTGLTNLEVLNVTNNNITINENIFDNMNKLKILNLSGNKLSTLNYINKNAAIETLNVSRNLLKALSESEFQNMKSLKTLDLSSNSIRDLHPKIFQNLHSLTHLYLANNNLNIFNIQTSHLYLDLSNNNLIEINQCHKIQGHVLLRENFLKNICTFGENTTSIDLSNNMLTEIKKEAFKNLKQLTYLALTHNFISKIDVDAFKNLFNLRELYLNKNEITALSIGTFHDLNSLTILDLSSNNIQELPVGLFTGLNDLRSLNLVDNSISFINNNVFHPLNGLEKLYLEKNPILEFDVQDLDYILTNLTEISFHIEKIGCNSLQEALNSLHESEVNINFGHEIKGPNVHGISCDPDEVELTHNFRGYEEFLKIKRFMQTLMSLFYLSIGLFIIFFVSHIISWLQKRRNKETFVKRNGASCSLTMLTENNQD